MKYIDYIMEKSVLVSNTNRNSHDKHMTVGARKELLVEDIRRELTYFSSPEFQKALEDNYAFKHSPFENFVLMAKDGKDLRINKLVVRSCEDGVAIIVNGDEVATCLGNRYFETDAFDCVAFNCLSYTLAMCMEFISRTIEETK